MNDKTDESKPKMWKIEGEAFEKVKAAHRKAYETAKEAERVKAETKQAMWDAIHEALPESQGLNLQLDTDHEPLGFYVIKEKGNELPGLLGALIGATKKAS